MVALCSKHTYEDPPSHHYVQEGNGDSVVKHDNAYADAMTKDEVSVCCGISQLLFMGCGRSLN